MFSQQSRQEPDDALPRRRSNWCKVPPIPGLPLGSGAQLAVGRSGFKKFLEWALRHDPNGLGAQVYLLKHSCTPSDSRRLLLLRNPRSPTFGWFEA